jgi:hypothetical protein
LVGEDECGEGTTEQEPEGTTEQAAARETAVVADGTFACGDEGEDCEVEGHFSSVEINWGVFSKKTRASSNSRRREYYLHFNK